MLYRELLGDSFDSLPPVLRRFHDLPVGDAHGVLRVTRGNGSLRSFVADALGLPKSGPLVPIHLRVETSGDQETWSRRFGTQHLITRQWAHDGLLTEAAGRYRMAVKLCVEPGRLVFGFVQAWLGPVPLPPWFTLWVDGTATASETAESWWIAVSVYAPILGLVARYEGEVTPDWT
jgi:hypothetical protein